MLSFLHFILFYFFGYAMWYMGILTPWPAIESASPTQGVQSPNHWSAMEVPTQGFRGFKSNDLLGLHAQSLQSCPALCHPMDCNLPGTSGHGILQASILEWVAVPSSRGSSPPRDCTQASCISCIAGGISTSEPPGKHYNGWVALITAGVESKSLTFFTFKNMCHL